MKLKGVILSLENVVYHGNRLEKNSYDEVGRLVRLLIRRGVQPVILSNHTRRMMDGSLLRDRIDRDWAPFPWFVASEGTGGWKPRAAAVGTVLNKMGWQPQEVVYLGNQKVDMKSAKNGGVLFLNAEWFVRSVNYGLSFASVRELARFFDLLCLRDHWWHFAIEDEDLRVYALSPFSTMKQEYEVYSANAREVLKHGGAKLDFWVKALCTSIYFTGVYQQIDYVAPYPGHRAGAGSDLLDPLLFQVATCFGIPYLHDLIIRHSDAPKSQWDRQGADHLRQLNTVALNSNPHRSMSGKQYKQSPLTRGKTVLVVDDFCTKGYSLEAARNFIVQTGADVVSVAFLKTINTDYLKLSELLPFDPYQPSGFASGDGKQLDYSYHANVVDSEAPTELTEAFEAYDSWDWPTNLSP